MTLYMGDCLDVLPTLPEKSIRCCVTSPPYYGLRDYGHAGQIGLEDTPEAYVARLVDVFRAVRRLLTDDGTLWLNLGDSYGHGTAATRQISRTSTKVSANQHEAQGGRHGGPAKQLLGIPWRVAFALQADGWYLRSDIIWHKPNAMPESVRDRPTKAHEYMFLLTKQARYYYDADAVREPHADPSRTAKPAPRGSTTWAREAPLGSPQQGSGCDGLGQHPNGRNRRTVWTIATKPYSGAHFAVMPAALVEPCILAGSAPGDTVLDPFAGSGTVGAVAVQHGRAFVGVELNADYLALAEQRIAAAVPA